MNGSSIFKLLTFAFLLCVSAAATLSVSGKPSRETDDKAPAQIQFAQIVVNGRTLTGPNSAARLRDGRIMIPVSVLAGALGDAVAVSPSARTVTVRRQTGITAAFDASQGQVRETAPSF